MPTPSPRRRPGPSVPVRRRRLVLVVLALVVAGLWVAHRHGPTPAAAVTPLDPARFAAGSCLSEAPTGPANGRTVFLDAGHGGPDPGGVGTTETGATVDEATTTLPVELDAAGLLRAAGYRVVVSRTADTSVVRLTPADVDGTELSLLGAHEDVVARAECADLAHADVLVGIYYDAAGSASAAGSIAAWDPARPFAAASHRLAVLVQRDVLAQLNAHGWGIPDDGVRTDVTLGSLSGDPSQGGLAAEAASYDHLLLLGPARAGYFTSPTSMPGTVVEPLYLTDPFEGSLAEEPTAQEAIARGVATAVEQDLGRRHP